MQTTFVMRKRDINIANNELAGGMDCDCCCPLAQVMNRVTGARWSIGVSEAENVHTGARYMLPDEALTFKDQWDKGGRAEPITFCLDIK